jgi:hypothetical protein
MRFTLLRVRLACIFSFRLALHLNLKEIKCSIFSSIIIFLVKNLKSYLTAVLLFMGNLHSIPTLVTIYALSVIFLHTVFSYDIQRFEKLAEQGTKTEGYIAGKMCDDHGYYLYKFRVDEESYRVI